MKLNFRVIVDVDLDSETNQSKFEILQPSDQQKLSIEQIAATLSGALALCIRLSPNESEMMRTTIDYLNHEFVNPNAFLDGEVLL
jgi:hypothetical protein